MWLSRFKYGICGEKKVVHFFGAIEFLAQIHEIQPKKSRHFLTTQILYLNLLSHISYLTIMISYRNVVSLHRIVSCLTVHCTTVIVSYPRHIVSHLISVFSAAAANRSKVAGCRLHCVSGHMYSKHRGQLQTPQPARFLC